MHYVVERDVMEASAPTEYHSVFDTDISTLHKLLTDDANFAQVTSLRILALGGRGTTI